MLTEINNNNKRKPNTNSSLKLNYTRLIVTNQTLLMQYRYKQSFWDRYRWCLTKKFLIICKDRSAVESILETTEKRLHYYLFAVVILNSLTLLFSFTWTRTFCSLNDQHDHTDNIHSPVHVYSLYFVPPHISCTVYSIFVARMVSNRMHKHELIFNEKYCQIFPWMNGNQVFSDLGPCPLPRVWIK